MVAVNLGGAPTVRRWRLRTRPRMQFTGATGSYQGACPVILGPDDE
jgi:hypothetical protein